MTVPTRYSALDRLLHRIAFAGPTLQLALAEAEERLFATELTQQAARRPLFIAGLPRAGTTHLLNVFAASDELATNSYRDMPFVLSPLLWDRFSRPFRRTASRQERPHGDGMTVGYDSPEAFEETIWLAFWPEKYQGDRIALWTAEDRKPDFEAFLARHMRKVAALRAAAEEGPGHRRYLSKNNANIARLALLPAVFPDCRVLVPFREPLSHAQSLWRQHRRFRHIHAQDPFARRYMATLGHFEFGADLKPIAFGGVAGDSDRAGFWLRYWLDVHGALERIEGNAVVFVDHADLCADPERAVAHLAGAADVSFSAKMRKETKRPHSPRQYETPKDPDFIDLLPEAQGLYARLRRRAGAFGPRLAAG